MELTMDKIMAASLGETGSEIKATYKKTLNVKQYETEVVELETTLRVEKDLTAGERMLICALLQAQLEYTAYVQLTFKGLVTPDQLSMRKKSLEEGIKAIKEKAEAILSTNLDNLFEFTDIKE